MKDCKSEYLIGQIFGIIFGLAIGYAIWGIS